MSREETMNGRPGPGGGEPGLDACLSDETLFLYTEGILEPEEARSVSAHLKACPPCRQRYQQEAEFSVSLRALPVPVPPRGFARDVAQRIGLGSQRTLSRWWWLVAALLAVTPGAAWVISAATGAGAESLVADLLTALVRSPLVVVSWVTSPDSRLLLGTATRALAESVASSPPLLITSIVALGAMALTVNCLIWLAARYALRAGR